MEPAGEASPRFLARIAGVFYLLTILTGVFALWAGGGLVVSGDAAATAANILAHESSFRLGFVANIIATVCYIVVTVLLYILFKPVSRSLSLVAAFISIVGCSGGGIGGLAPLVVLGGAQSSTAFKLDQLQALAALLIKLDAQAYLGAMVFFGFYCILIGYLAFNSTFLPRIVGVLMVIAGICWLTNSFASFLSPPLASALSPYILVPGFLGESTLTVWLLLKGVNEQRWKELSNS